MPTDPETDAALKQQKTVRKAMEEAKTEKIVRAVRDVLGDSTVAITTVARNRGIAVEALTKAVDAELARRGLPPRKGRGTR